MDAAMMLLFFTLIGITVAILIFLGLEYISGVFQAKSISLNAFCGFFCLVLTQLFSASIAPGVIWLSGKIGRPPIHLSGRGWMFPVSILLALALMDLMQYAFHRLEHKIPWLWAMHSLHHSDSAMNTTTAYRNFWIDRLLYILWLIPFGLLVRIDTGVMLCVTVAMWAIPAFEHSSIRFGLAKFSWLIVTPQFHRVHHSILQEHYDRNFATFLPLLDVLFGTYLEPDGYPDTGLAEGEPHSIKDSLLWPFHQ